MGGKGSGKGPRPQSRRRHEQDRTDDGTAARKLLLLHEFCSSQTKVDRNNPKEIDSRFVKYCKFCAQNGLVPYWLGFCNSLGYSIWAVDKWISGEVSICKESLQVLKIVREQIQQNAIQLMVDGKLRDVVGIYITKAMNPDYWMPEVAKSAISITNINMGELPNSEQLAGKWLPTSGNAIEVQNYKVLDIPEEKEKQETSIDKTYND